MSERPNLLLVTTDQQRWDAAGGTGPDFLRTPHFNHLCRLGVRFNRAYTDCPMCVPARVTIMTGQPAHRHGLTANGPTTGHMGASSTLPGLLSAAGYQTMAIGKMHFDPQRTRHGFQEMILPDDYYREMARRGGGEPMRHGLGQNELFATMATVPENETLTSWTAERCVDFIRYRRDPATPFFLWASFSKPHPPLDPPEPYYSMYRDSPIPEPVIGDWCDDDCPEVMRRFRESYGHDKLSPEIIRAARAAYYGLITQIDYNMGRILSALRVTDTMRNTIILYTSDHGEFLGDHRMGAKFFFHEPSAHVPMVLRLPPAEPWITSNRSVDDLVSLADICPTFLRAAGVEPPEGMDGLDLAKIARGGSAPADRHIVSVYTPGDCCEHLAITDGRWKYIWFPEGPAEQLFDLETDPTECTNLAGRPEVAEKQQALQEAMVAELVETKSPHVVEGQLPQTPVKRESPGYRGTLDFPGFLLNEDHRDARH